MKIRTIVCLIIILAAVLNSLILTNLVQAEKVGDPLATDALRLQQYRKTIKDYLYAVENIINLGDYAQDAIVIQELFDSTKADYRGGRQCGDRNIYLDEDSAEYYVYRMEVNAAQMEYNNTNLLSGIRAISNKYTASERESDLRNGKINPYDLAYQTDYKIWAFLFTLRRICESPYRPESEKQYDQKLLAAYEKRNQKVIASGKKYLRSVLRRIEHELFWMGSQPAPGKKFRLARSASRFAFLAYKRLTHDLVVVREQKYHEWLGETYNAYVIFANARALAALSVNPHYGSVGLNGDAYAQINILGTAQRVGWNKFAAVKAKEISGGYAWNYIYERNRPDQGRWVTDVKDTIYEPQVLETYYYCNNFDAEVAGLESKINRNMANYRVILDWYRNKLEADNRAYNAFKAAYEQLAANCNRIDQKYQSTELQGNLLVVLREAKVSERQISLSSYTGQVREFVYEDHLVGNNWQPDAHIKQQGDRLYASEEVSSRDKVSWIIRSIPETEHAKSKRYVLNQNAQEGLSFDFAPDLAGDWQVEMIVTKDLRTVHDIKVVNKQRCILWIRHANQPYDPNTRLGIELVLYDPKAPWGSPLHPENAFTQPEYENWGGPYFLEKATIKAGLYLNYDDQGNPVDPYTNFCSASAPAQLPSYAVPSGIVTNGKVATFALGRLAGSRANNVWRYEGNYGSTHIYYQLYFFPKFYPEGGELIITLVADGRKTEGSFTHQGYNIIKADVFDPQITEFVCSIDGKMQKGRMENPNDPFCKFTSFLKIDQDIDYGFAFNKSGRLVWLKKTPAVSAVSKATNVIPDTPDCLEKRAMDALAGWRQEQDVKRILEMRYWESGREQGAYLMGTKDIFISSRHRELRYNLPSVSDYGFSAPASFDSVVRHEAFHSYFCNRLSEFTDIDCDGIPGVPGPQGFPGGRAFSYAWDSPTNFFGAFGPVLTGPLPDAPTTLTYAGDQQKDNSSGAEKCILHPLNYSRNPRFAIDSFSAGSDQTGNRIYKLPLPIGIPINDFADTFKLNIYFLVSKGPQKMVYMLKEKQHYRIEKHMEIFNDKVYEFLGFRNTIAPALKLSVSPEQDRRIEETLKTYENAGYTVGGLFVYYKPAAAHGSFSLEEYDAERNSDFAVSYVGSWGY
jgi:hypothetical protein